MNFKLRSILIGAILIFSLPKNTQAQVIINEIVASNSGGIEDPDFEDTGDWIELYNSSNTAVDLSYYSITDNFDEIDKWRLPEGTVIGAQEYLLIWADGNTTGLHTNFKLSSAGEQVGLYDVQGNLLDSIIYSNLITDISFGRKTDGADAWGYFQIPTPGEANNNEFAFEGLVFHRPKFSVKGGFHDNTIEVELSAIAGNIRYTVDGSFPTETSPVYSDPIVMSNTTILRAAVFLPNYIQGKTSTQSYFINEDLEARKLPIVSIATNPEYFWDDSIGLYVQDFKPSWRYPINFELFENDGSDRAAINELAGVKVNGLNSWVLPQKMLGIYFDNEYDQNNLEYPLFFDRARSRYDNFTLRASGSDWSHTMIRDGLSQSLTIGITDLGQIGYRPSIVFINGEYMGIHNIRSRVDESFIEDNYGLSGSEYDLIENNGVVEQGDDIAFNEWMDLLNSDLSNQSNYDAVKEIMDVENCIDFYVTEMWTGNSSFGHNIQFWKPRDNESKWKWIAQDFDRGMEGIENELLDYFTNTQHVYAWINTPFSKLMLNQEFRDAFISRFADHLYTTYHPKRVDEFITKFETRIENEMPYHIAKWQGTTSSYGNAIPSFDYWKNQIMELRNYNNARSEVLYNNLIENFEVEEKVVLGVNSSVENGGEVFINDLEIPASNWTGYYFTNVPFELRAEPLAGHEFQGWSEMIIDTLIEKAATWKYFDQGIYPGNDWTALTFNDASWSEGQAQLGYGDGDENTLISFGGNSNDKHITTYFRKKITVNNTSDFSNQIFLNLLRDDAAIVYLNGEEVIRSNIQEGIVNFETPAITYVSGEEENLYLSFELNVNELLEGENVIAVEIHQSGPTSSDLSFDLELLGLRKSNTIISTDPTLSVNLTTDKVFCTNYSVNSICIVPDTIFENTTLTADCSPYYVREDVVILPNKKLIVEAGVEVLFPENGSLYVYGGLEVKGEENELVRFLPNEALGTSEWGHIYFENATDTSSLAWMEIVGATQGAHPLKENAAIAAWNSIVTMNHMIIEDVENNPILGRYSDIWLRNSQLHSKVTGDLINVKYGYGFIDSCDFRGNAQVDTDAIDYDDVKDGVIMNSKIYNFLGFNSDGIDLGEESSGIILENNFIHHITDKGVSIGQQSTVFSKNNTLVECSQGFGIKDEGFGSIEQTTFYNNINDIVAFEKNIGSGGGFIEVANTIFSNTVYEPILSDETSDVQVTYSLSDTDSLQGNFILNIDPLFKNPTQNNFDLLPTSPAINTGVSTTGGIIDLGTSNHMYEAKASIVITGIHYHPADTSAAEFIEIQNPANEDIDISGYSFVDGILFSFPVGTIISSNEVIRIVKDVNFHADYIGQIYQWESGSLSNAGEKIILNDAYGVIVDHVRYNDKTPWPTAADGEGAFLKLTSLEVDNHFGKNWEANFDTKVKEVTDIDMTVIIYPNPTSGHFSIKIIGRWMNEVILFDMYGRELLIQNPTSDEEEMDISQLPNGIYFIRINDEIIKKVIKTN